VQLISRFGKAFWIGLLLIGLAVVVWFVAPGTRSCPTNIDIRDCDATMVVVLNILGLILFVVGGGLMLFAGGLARSRARQQQSAGSDDTT
jgi:hypothetical protein